MASPWDLLLDHLQWTSEKQKLKEQISAFNFLWKFVDDNFVIANEDIDEETTFEPFNVTHPNIKSSFEREDVGAKKNIFRKKT